MYCVNPIQTGWGLLAPPPPPPHPKKKNFKVEFNFEAVQVMTAKIYRCDAYVDIKLPWQLSFGSHVLQNLLLKKPIELLLSLSLLLSLLLLFLLLLLLYTN